MNMYYMDILLLTMLMAYGYAQRIHTQTPPGMGDEMYSKHHRNKRSDCWYRWDIADSCKCGDSCWQDSYRSTFSSQCGTHVNVNGCVVKSGDTYALSTYCTEQETYLDLECSQTGFSCGDGQTPYQCTCSNGYSPEHTTKIVIGTMSPFVIYSVIVTIILLLVHHKRRKSAKLEKKLQSGVIPIQCNVIAVVDDVDEFKDYTKRMMIALQDRFPKLVFDRVSKFDVLNYDYELKCDKLLVFRRIDDATLKAHTLAAIKKKVTFRYDAGRSAAVVCVGNDATNISEARDVFDEISLVPGLKHLDGWLPAVIKTIFGVNESCFNMHQSTYSINRDEATASSEYCLELQRTLENILTIFGATVTKSVNVATCKIVVLESINDKFLNNVETIRNKCFIFVSSGACISADKQKQVVNIFNRKETIIGILRILFKLNILSCKGLPNIKAMRYNPRTQEIVKYNNNNNTNNNSYCCV